MEEELEYECPECGALLPEGARFCTSCDAKFDQGDEEKDDVDELLEEIAKPGESGEEPGEDVEDEPRERDGEGVEVQGKLVEEISPEEEYEEVPPVEIKGPRLYAGTFSILGLSFIILTILALIMTIVVLRWDTWINGAAKENIGDYQMNFVYLGVAGIVVCLVVVIVDFIRNRKWKRG